MSRLALALSLAAFAALACAPLRAPRGLLALATEILVLLALAQAWNLLAGYGGMVSLGHHGLFGIGGYALFTLTRELPLNPYLAVPIAGFVTAALALLLVPVLFRLREVYFAIGMWVSAEVFRILVMRSDALGGVNGLPLSAARGLDRGSIPAITYWIALAVVAGAMLLVLVLMQGPLGLRLRALRDNETAARSIGVGSRQVRLTVFLISAALAGMAGSVHFLSVLFITPQAAFDINWTVAAVFATVIGGVGRLAGPILGVAIYFLLRETLAVQSGWYLVGLGVAAVATMSLAPTGLAGAVDRLRAAVRARRAG